MRIGLIFLGGLLNLTALSSELTHVSVTCREQAEFFQVAQSLQVRVAEGIDTVSLKVLNFSGSNIRRVDVPDYGFNWEEAANQGSLTIETSTPGTQTITITYEVFLGEKGELPLFFGNFQTNPVEEDFFQFDLTGDEAYDFLFPSIPPETTHINDQFRYQLSLVEAPSMIRLRKIDETATLNLIILADLFVVVTFVIIAVLIWRNRNRLMYG